ncbi:MAG: hypothetical protein WC006_05340 [Bacilli bacterium]
MTLIYILGIGVIAYLSLRSIAKSLKKGAVSYEYSKEEMRSNGSYDDYAFVNRK